MKHETYAQRALRKIAHEGKTVEQIAADAAAMVRRERMTPEGYNSIFGENDRITLRKMSICGRPNPERAREFMVRLVGEQLVLDMISGALMTQGGGDHEVT